MVRAVVVGDESFLWRMLLEAAHAGDEVDGVEALNGSRAGLFSRPAQSAWGVPQSLTCPTKRRTPAPTGAR
jgi:hypothetical protein